MLDSKKAINRAHLAKAPKESLGETAYDITETLYSALAFCSGAAFGVLLFGIIFFTSGHIYTQ